VGLADAVVIQDARLWRGLDGTALNGVNYFSVENNDREAKKTAAR
jgi:hypothetical protein